LFALVGVVGVLPLIAVGLSVVVPAIMVGVFLGAALRDVGIARRAARLWPIQRELFDCPMIEALVQGMADRPQLEGVSCFQPAIDPMGGFARSPS
jgi:hypothetical protein